MIIIILLKYHNISGLITKTTIQVIAVQTPHFAFCC